MMPYFSIITCTYNAGKTIEECIESVESQLFKEYEHIFIDGFSADNTMSVVRAYQSRSAGKVLVYQMEPSGVSRAMNQGVSFSKGEVILHLHGDDRLAGRNVLQNVKDLFERSKGTIVVGNCRFTGHPVMKQTWPENRIARAVYRAIFPILMFHLNPIPHPSAYLAKSVFIKHGGFDEKLKVVMDYDFWFRILKVERLTTTDQVLSIYRFHSDTISTRQMELGLREINQIQEKYRRDYPVRFLLYAVGFKSLLLFRKFIRRMCRLPRYSFPPPEISR